MSRLLPLCAVLLLISCATTKPVSDLQLNEVAVPVTVACVEEKDIPKVPKTALRADADVAALAAGAAVDVRELRRIVKRQDALLRACVSGGNP